MKVAILILALVAIIASMAYAAPWDEDNQLNAIVEDIFQDEETPEEDYDDDRLADLQDLIAQQQNKAQMQWKRIASSLARKAVPLIKKHGPRIVEELGDEILG